MADDELSAPLGRKSKSKPRLRAPVALPQAIAALLGLTILVCAVWALTVDDPLGGEPVVVVSTATDAQTPVATMPAVTSPGAINASKAAREASAAPPSAAPRAAGPRPGTNTVTIIDGSTGKRQEVPIAGARDARAPIDQRLLEASRHGPIPRIGPDGARPAEVYARRLPPVPARKSAPQIAVVVQGLGVSAANTEQAITKLPGPVTLAFLPYGAEVDHAATRARAEGHEVLLQLPMEPFDYPDNDPGPQTLLMSLSAEQNLDRMHWLMSRIQGYVGVVNYMGARFTSSEQALGPALREIGRRGLIYFDDGSSPRSLAGQIAGANNLPFVRAEVAIDAVPTPQNIDRALTRLEALARERGVAVGVASALPATIERLAQWAKGAEARGTVLVPISALAIRPKSS